MPVFKRQDTPANQVEPGLYGLKLLDGREGARHVSLVRGWMEPGARHSGHVHDVEEAVVFLAGRGLVEIDGVAHEVGPGDVVHIPAGSAHTTLNTGEVDLTFIAAFADNLIASNPLQTSGGHRPDAGALSGLRHRLAWVLRRVARRIAPPPGP